MSIIYALVARGYDHVLAEYTSSGLRGNFSTVTRVLLKKIPSDADSSLSYVYDKYVFHYMVSDGLTYLCMTDSEFSRQVAFKFLAEIKRRFVQMYGDRGKTALAFAMNADFERVLQAQMEYFNQQRGDDRVSQVNEQIAEVRGLMVQNIDRVLERGEKIELLVDKTDELERNAVKFKKSARHLKHAMWWKNAKLCIIIALILAVVIYVILAISCGGLNLKKCT
jgi:vesicle-associated membrane protein 7